MDIHVRPITDHESQRFRTAIARGFGGDSRKEDHDRFYVTLPLDRTVAAFDGDEIVGTLGEFDFALTVPGGHALPMAGTTVVTVRATHRRRGVLRSMMQSHLATAAERGDPWPACGRARPPSTGGSASAWPPTATRSTSTGGPPRCRPAPTTCRCI